MSTTSALIQLTQQATGENRDTWGTVNNANLTKLENAIAGVEAIASTGGTTTLTNDQARNAILSFSGVLVSDHTVVVPARSKIWLVKNGHTGGSAVLKFKTASGTAVTIPAGDYPVNVVFCDGTDIYIIGATEALIDAAISGSKGVFICNTVGGTGDAITATTDSSFAYTAGFMLIWLVGADNTSTTTINVNALGAKSIFKSGVVGPRSLQGKELQQNQIAAAIYDGTRFQLLNASHVLFGAIASLASDPTTDLGTMPTHNVLITGTTAITAFGSEALIDSPIYFIRFDGALTLTYNATSLIIPGAQDIQTAQGDSAIVEYLGSGNWRVRQYQRASSPPAIAPLGGAVRALTINVTSNTALTVAASGVSLLNSSNFPKNFFTVSESIATGVTGAGGLDTGAMANSTWYAVWLIGKEDGTIDAMLSTSATAPTMPSGYTYKLRVGWVRTDGAAALYRTKQVGNKAVYVIGTNPTTARQMASGSAGDITVPTWVAVATGAYVPTTAVEILLYGTTEGPGVSSTYGIIVAPNNSYGAYNSGTNPPPFGGYYAIGTLGGLMTLCGSLVLETTDIYWAAMNSVSELYCQGWVDNL